MPWERSLAPALPVVQPPLLVRVPHAELHPTRTVYPAVDLNLLSDDRDLTRLADGVRRLARLVVNPALNPNPDDLFPASYTPRIKRLSTFSEANRRVTLSSPVCSICRRPCVASSCALSC